MIKRPSEEELEVQEAQDRIEQEQWAELEIKRIESQNKVATLKYAVQYRYKALTAIAQFPLHATVLWIIFFLTIFKKPVPTVLEDILRK